MAAQLMKESEVAEVFGVGVRTLYNWRNDGIGPPFIKVGATIRYDAAKLADWIAANTENGGVANNLDPATKGRIDAEAMAAAH